jgi:type IV pilus assembly protein PilF
MRKLLNHFFILILVLTLTACASSGNSSLDQPSDERRAAETNAALGRQYLDRRQYEIAQEKLKRAVAYDKTYAPAHTLLGVLYETLGQRDQAEHEYRLAVDYDPADGDVNNNYAVFLCSQNKGREADKYFQAAMEDPFYETPAVVYRNAGQCALGMNDLDKAEQNLRQSLEYDAGFAAALLPMANVYYRKGEFLRARAFLQRYESAAESDAQSLYQGYQIEEALGDKTAVDRYRSDLLNRYPNSAEAAKARQ